MRKNLVPGNNTDGGITTYAETVAKKIFLKHCLEYRMDPEILLVYVPQDALMRMLEDVASTVEADMR